MINGYLGNLVFGINDSFIVIYHIWFESQTGQGFLATSVTLDFWLG